MHREGNWNPAPLGSNYLMILAPLTAALYDKFSAEDDEPRNHLGASVIGGDCTRKIFYSYRWAQTEYFEPRMLRLFNRGHEEEPRIINRLRKAGLEVFAAGESGELKEQLRISDCNGHFGGTPDGVVLKIPDLPPDTPALLEMKTHSYDLFEKVIKQGVYESNRKYYTQMQIYMHKHELEWGLYVGVCKDDDRVHFQLIPYRREYAEHYIELAGQIIFAETLPPRISATPGFWKCKFCHHRSTCHDGVMPDVNCRTCLFATPLEGGVWGCGADREEVRTSPRKGCNQWQVNTNFFSDDVPF